MKPIKKIVRQKHRGAALIISMICVLIFSALVVSMASLSGTNVQLADNQHKVNSALLAAQSGLEVGNYLVISYSQSDEAVITDDYVTQADKDQTWQNLCAYVQNNIIGNADWTDPSGTGNELVSSNINFGSGNENFRVRFCYDGNSIMLESTGNVPTSDSPVTKQAAIDMAIERNGEVLNYAIASRGRMWLTGDSTIHGNIFSSWNRADISPFNMTDDSRVNGTINTVLTLEEIENEAAFQMETLDENGNPIDADGNPLGNNYEDRYYGPDDEVQAYHKGINYGQQFNLENVPGMDIADYDTDEYNSSLTDIGSSSNTEVEYFPHVAGDYSQPSSYWSRRLDRHVYENQTFTDAYLPDNRNALFRNCTFGGVLYIDCYKSSSSKYNNVRFENCQFNGTIITDVPQQFKWKYNCLYFTGEATFNNETDIPATILAPHFNVNLGNTNPEQGDNNVLTGAIIGGIVDVRGNAQIYGTIISMCDTTGWSSGYVTNIGATLGDGGSETTEPGDVGVIDITPPEDKMLPSGIMSPIVIVPLQGTYSEGT